MSSSTPHSSFFWNSFWSTDDYWFCEGNKKATEWRASNCLVASYNKGCVAAWLLILKIRKAKSNAMQQQYLLHNRWNQILVLKSTYIGPFGNPDKLLWFSGIPTTLAQCLRHRLYSEWQGFLLSYDPPTACHFTSCTQSAQGFNIYKAPLCEDIAAVTSRCLVNFPMRVSLLIDRLSKLLNWMISYDTAEAPKTQLCSKECRSTVE